MATQIKNYLICSGEDEIHYFDLSPFYANWWASVVGSLPTGISAAEDAITGSTVGFLVDYSALATGTNTVTIEGFEQESTGDSLGKFTLVFEKNSCTTEVEVCCAIGYVSLAWLSINGGIKQWPFPGVREFNIKVGEANTFKDSSYQVQYSERKNVYTGKRVTSDSISQEQVDFLDDLRYSIQAWEINQDTKVRTAILLDNESFRKYESREKFFDVSIQYVIAQQILVQTQ
jgi:hypothetical protein